MQALKDSITASIERRLKELEEEEQQLIKYRERRLDVANDAYYAGIARNKARQEARQATARIDKVIEKKIALMNELKSL